MSITSFDMISVCEKAAASNRFGWKLEKFDELPSTNSYAKENCSKWNSPTLIIAKHQTEGRGRGEHSWEDVDGCFLSTWSFELIDYKIDPRWSLGIGLYLYECLVDCFGFKNFSLKAPNDIYIANKKVAGLLIEATSGDGRDDLHVGLGINVFGFPQQHNGLATSLAHNLSHRELNAGNFNRFIQSFGSCLQHLEKRAGPDAGVWLQRISKRLAGALNTYQGYTDNPVVAIDPSGTIKRQSGEISWRDL